MISAVSAVVTAFTPFDAVRARRRCLLAARFSGFAIFHAALLAATRSRFAAFHAAAFAAARSLFASVHAAVHAFAHVLQLFCSLCLLDLFLLNALTGFDSLHLLHVFMSFPFFGLGGDPPLPRLSGHLSSCVGSLSLLCAQRVCLLPSGWYPKIYHTSCLRRLCGNHRIGCVGPDFGAPAVACGSPIRKPGLASGIDH